MYACDAGVLLLPAYASRIVNLHTLLRRHLVRGDILDRLHPAKKFVQAIWKLVTHAEHRRHSARGQLPNVAQSYSPTEINSWKFVLPNAFHMWDRTECAAVNPGDQAGPNSRRVDSVRPRAEAHSIRKPPECRKMCVRARQPALDGKKSRSYPLATLVVMAYYDILVDTLDTVTRGCVLDVNRHGDTSSG